MRDQTRAYLFAVASILCWSTVATVFKLTLRGTDPLSLLFGASLSAAIFFWLARAVRRWIRRGQRIAPRPPLDRSLRRSALNGLLNPFLYYVVLFRAYDILPAQEAQPLNYTWPIVLVLLSAPFLGQALRLPDLAGLSISFVGVAVIALRGNLMGATFSNPLGVGLALGSSVIWAAFWIRNLRDDRDALEKLSLGATFGFLFTAALMAILGRAPSLPPGPLAGSIYTGIFEMGLPFLFWLRALSLSETSAKVGRLVFLSPFLSLIFIGLVLGETIRSSSLIGLILIIAGILIQQLWAPRQRSTVL